VRSSKTAMHHNASIKAKHAVVDSTQDSHGKRRHQLTRTTGWRQPGGTAFPLRSRHGNKPRHRRTVTTKQAAHIQHTSDERGSAAKVGESPAAAACAKRGRACRKNGERSQSSQPPPTHCSFEFAATKPRRRSTSAKHDRTHDDEHDHERQHANGEDDAKGAWSAQDTVHGR
jgi:hypothetical protein